MGYHIGMILHWLAARWLKKQQKEVSQSCLLAESRAETCTYQLRQIELEM